jgi:protocatechuate 3,4-dioxygenase beta subunit
MDDRPDKTLGRRAFLGIGAAGAAGLLVGGCATDGAARDAALPVGDGPPAGGDGSLVVADAGGAFLCETPSCDDDEPTEPNIEGPFYRSGAPERADLTEPGLEGTRLTVRGRVYSTSCAPLAGALLDVWQATVAGDYPRGWVLRGRLWTDASGCYELRTIVPGRYLNGPTYRPAHIHVKASAPGHNLITTQLYFAGDPYNASDPFIRPSLIMTLADAGEGERAAIFDFVLGPAA